MQRYFAKNKIDNELFLYDSDIHHIKNVMRYKESDKIEVVFNEKGYICIIKSLSPFKIEIIDEIIESKELRVDLTVAVALVQEQKFDLIIQKLTELGIKRIIPIKTERSIVKLDNTRIEKKYSRWNMICKEASEQSKRTSIPVIENVMTLKELIKENANLKLICSVNEKKQFLDKYLKKYIKSIIFAIGPEGGFSNLEESLLLENGFEAVSLGARVMRVETAAICVTSIMNYKYEG